MRITSGSPPRGKIRNPRVDGSTAPMLPPSSAGAARNAYSAAPPSALTRIRLEKGKLPGMHMLPSTTACAPS